MDICVEFWYRTYVLVTVASAGRRLCGRCRRRRSLSEFNVSSAFGWQHYCRECQSAWYRERRAQHMANVNANGQRYRARNAAFVVSYLETHPCVGCGESNPAVLEFDHVGPKLRPVSALRWGSHPIGRIKEEIERCEVRCVNCRMKRTAGQFGWRKAREDWRDASLFEMRD